MDEWENNRNKEKKECKESEKKEEMRSRGENVGIDLVSVLTDRIAP